MRTMWENDLKSLDPCRPSLKYPVKSWFWTCNELAVVFRVHSKPHKSSVAKVWFQDMFCFQFQNGNAAKQQQHFWSPVLLKKSENTNFTLAEAVRNPTNKQTVSFQVVPCVNFKTKNVLTRQCEAISKLRCQYGQVFYNKFNAVDRALHLVYFRIPWSHMFGCGYCHGCMMYIWYVLKRTIGTRIEFVYMYTGIYVYTNVMVDMRVVVHRNVITPTPQPPSDRNHKPNSYSGMTPMKLDS